MRICFISDLHIEFRNPAEITVLADTINACEADIVIDAGDLHPYQADRAAFQQLINKPYLHVMGNHDYYGNRLASCKWATTDLPIKIVGCTLWTDFKNGDPWVMKDYKKSLADVSVTVGSSANKVQEIHLDHLEFIEDEKPDLVVTHHCPSFKSVHPAFYSSGDMNYYFMSELDDFILANTNIKHWVHGHTHTQFDYMIGACRVMCNPCGYPHERKSVASYVPLVLEV
jgi:predicted phosphodiesterase